jgi:hypothetical protein
MQKYEVGGESEAGFPWLNYRGRNSTHSETAAGSNPYQTTTVAVWLLALFFRCQAPSLTRLAENAQ